MRGSTDELDRIELERLAPSRLKVLGRLNRQQSGRCNDGLRRVKERGVSSCRTNSRPATGDRERTDLVRLTRHIDSRVLRVMVVLQSSRKQTLEDHIIIEQLADIWSKRVRGPTCGQRGDGELKGGRGASSPATTSFTSPGGACRIYLDTTATRSSVESSSMSDMARKMCLWESSASGR